MMFKVIIAHPSYVSWILRPSLLRKELKTKGLIGEANQKDKLTYVSLMHKIGEVQEAGYEESEIVSSVIKLMIPSLTLRNVLESTPNLSLSQLLQNLEAHFYEWNATDLCSKLTSMVLNISISRGVLKSEKRLYWHQIRLTLSVIRNWPESFFIVP